MAQPPQDQERKYSAASREEVFDEIDKEEKPPSLVKGSAVLSRTNSIVSTISNESGRDIKLRTMSWKKTAAVLFGEYVCLAIMSFPASFMALGMVGGIIATLGIGVITLYTSMTLWKFQMKHPECRDICDIGYKLFGNSRIAYELTTFGLLANNLMILGLHTSTGAKVFSTLTDSQQCNIIWAVVTMVICILLSLPRTLTQVSFQSVISAILMFTSVMLCMVFAGIEDEPAGYVEGTVVKASALAPPGTTFVAGFNAILNITYTFIGQICYPSFIAEMENPADFPKALYACTVAEFILFTVPGIVIYYYMGQYTVAPAFAGLQPLYKKIAFTMALPTIIVIGVIYANITAKYLFNRIYRNSHHRYSNTWQGWSMWVALIVIIWILGFIIGEAVPFFGDLLSLISSLFDSFFGLIFWGYAYLVLNKGNWFTTKKQTFWTILNILIIIIGIIVFGVGTYTSIQSILNDYAVGAVRYPFTCASSAI
ncbi:hypothetical protein K450DRAFT_221572 [Umbelopsis ramanniana AG]|uniref:Amino acid transporter transmembrane domain-containing protein n=1 Tax=Umbelopsis ramanniana AG TaxID=1314678 RepID=A0AAD5EGQ4_UMBRA|nr:uncharacterized protein K450DRAFT_221572 [Umbelopsis ramanniana AG]KAI8583521.1 hypothetical protein K450DRAFT_221572 [Umbelopsis ramanniana AG]